MGGLFSKPKDNSKELESQARIAAFQKKRLDKEEALERQAEGARKRSLLAGRGSASTFSGSALGFRGASSKLGHVD